MLAYMNFELLRQSSGTRWWDIDEVLQELVIGACQTMVLEPVLFQGFRWYECPCLTCPSACCVITAFPPDRGNYLNLGRRQKTTTHGIFNKYYIATNSWSHARSHNYTDDQYKKTCDRKRHEVTIYLVEDRLILKELWRRAKVPVRLRGFFPSHRKGFVQLLKPCQGFL